MRALYLYPLLWLTLTVMLSAQVSSQPPTQPPTFRIISAAGSYSDLRYDINSGRKTISVPIGLTRTLSSPLRRPEGSKIEFYRMAPAPPGSPPYARDIRQVVTTVTLPTPESGYTIVTFPLSQDKTGPLRSKLVPPSDKSHHAGTLRIINFSSYTVGVAIDESQHAFPSGSIGVMPISSGRILLQVAINKSGRWIKAFHGERRIAPQLRGEVFIFNYIIDPDFGEMHVPPPALVRTIFEVSPEALD